MCKDAGATPKGWCAAGCRHTLPDRDAVFCLRISIIGKGEKTARAKTVRGAALFRIGGKRLYKIDDFSPYFGIAYFDKCPIQLQAFGGGQEIHNIVGARGL